MPAAVAQHYSEGDEEVGNEEDDDDDNDLTRELNLDGHVEEVDEELFHYGGEDDEDDDEGEANMDWPATEAVAPSEDDRKVQRKLLLFKAKSIEASLLRLWNQLPLDEQGELRMEGYVELNLRLQRCLTRDFSLERAVDSAIGDWSEDVRDGQKSMAWEEFAMFMFELCSLWCGPAVSLRAYLLFLNSTFVAVTDARGAHTIGLKPLDAIQRLPKPFFDLLSLQGWSKQAVHESESSQMDDDQALNSWYARNLAPDSERQSLLQVQRQVFQVTHDARSVFLFRDMDGRRRDETDVLELLKTSTQKLQKVFQATPPASLPPVNTSSGGSGGNHRNRSATCTDIAPRPWCPSSYTKAPGALLPGAIKKTVPSSTALARARGQSAPAPYRPPRATQALAAAVMSSKRPEPIPVGRAFDSRVASGRMRGLALAGHMASGPVSTRVMESHRLSNADRYLVPEPVGVSISLRDRSSSLSESYVDEGASDVVRELPSSCDADGLVQQAGLAEVQGDASQNESYVRLDSTTWDTATMTDVEREERDRIYSETTQMLDNSLLIPPYKLPRNPADLYQKQTMPLMKADPETVVFRAKQFQDEKRKEYEPFDRALKKLPECCRPTASGPGSGPMQHPSELVWCEMSHRLQTILQRQGKRAERRRKRRMRSKLFGRAPRRPKPGQEGKRLGRDLREYLDRYAAQPASGLADKPGEFVGEFLGGVQEKYLQKKDVLDAYEARWQVIGSSPREQRTRPIRPIYMPPPVDAPAFAND